MPFFTSLKISRRNLRPNNVSSEFHASGSKRYTANGASNDVSVVDLKSRKELRRIKVDDGPWGVAIVKRREIVPSN
jgi:YVTN family beta-propeller protein